MKKKHLGAQMMAKTLHSKRTKQQRSESARNAANARWAKDTPSMPPAKDTRRTMLELARAIAYLHDIAERSMSDLNRQQGELVYKVASKGMQMLAWALGDDNEFGRMVTAFLDDDGAMVTPTDSTIH